MGERRGHRRERREQIVLGTELPGRLQPLDQRVVRHFPASHSSAGLVECVPHHRFVDLYPSVQPKLRRGKRLHGPAHENGRQLPLVELRIEVDDGVHSFACEADVVMRFLERGNRVSVRDPRNLLGHGLPQQRGVVQWLGQASQHRRHDRIRGVQEGIQKPLKVAKGPARSRCPLRAGLPKIVIKLRANELRKEVERRKRSSS
mmetsp:Transcript_12962/g.48041  ORF Transcript_12962/g.48041 Transcript_12962/m.48041 type:complete len:203 (-) Transcript_12962:718-1326(-)